MAQHNPQSRAYLAIVMAGIVAGFTIASLLAGCSETETGSEDSSKPAASDTSESGAPSSDAEVPMEGTSMDETPPIERPLDPDSMNLDAILDDVSPPDELVDEPLLDAVPEVVTGDPATNDGAPEAPAAETPPPAQNP